MPWLAATARLQGVVDNAGACSGFRQQWQDRATLRGLPYGVTNAEGRFSYSEEDKEGKEDKDDRDDRDDEKMMMEKEKTMVLTAIGGSNNIKWDSSLRRLIYIGNKSGMIDGHTRLKKVEVTDADIL